MSQMHKGIFGALALGLTLGAVQLAFANDLMGTRQVSAAAPEIGINRGAKADRSSVPASSGQTRTIALRHDGVADTSVLVRMPVAKDARNGQTPAVPKPASKRIAVACEPPVSVLTEVARLLQPGRCVT